MGEVVGGGHDGGEAGVRGGPGLLGGHGGARQPGVQTRMEVDLPGESCETHVSHAHLDTPDP